MKEELQEGGVLRIALSPEDLRHPEQLYSRFEQIIVEDEVKRILVDLSGVRDATSLMIGALIALHLLAYENLAVLKFTGLNPKIHMLFRLLGVDKVLESHHGPASTSGSFHTAGAPPGLED